MHRTTRFVVTTAASLALVAVANTANAGEPFHPIVDLIQPAINFFIGWF